MIRVLMLALEFPPVNSTGCFRYLKFIKYLHEFNVHTIVIVPTIPDLVRIHSNATIDNSLLNDIPNSVEIIRIPLPGNSEYTLRKKSFKTRLLHLLRTGGEVVANEWEKNLFLSLDSIVANKKPDCLFTSLPPFSLGKVAQKITKKYSLPLVVDFRDEWSLNKGTPFQTYLHFKRAFLNEEFILKMATKVTVVTQPLLDIFKQIHKGIKPDTISLLTNGFDHEKLNLLPFENIPSDGIKEYIIGYSGSFYYDPKSADLSNRKFSERPGLKKLSYQQDFTKEDWSYRSPLYFIKALNELFKRRKDLMSVVKFHHIGHTPLWLNHMIEENGLTKNFKSHGFVSKTKNLKIQQDFNALLCTSEKVINSNHYCLSSKVFDYVQMQKPILAFVTDGITKEFIQLSKCGLICNPDDTIECSLIIEMLVDKNISFYPDRNYLEKFHPRNLTGQLAKIFYSAINDFQN